MADDPAQRGPQRIGEFEIIDRYFAPLAAETAGAFGLRDDAALLTPAEGDELVATADMIVEGVHFRPDDRPEDIAWKALAVNVSDLVAKGAEPVVYLLSLALPAAPDLAWLEGLAAGLAAAQETFGCRLTGGDTTATPGPATLAVTALGRLPRGTMVRRSGARAGDVVYVSGTIGDAALGLRLLREGEQWGLDAAQATSLRQRYWQPLPPIGLTAALRQWARAAMDISDGLVGDLRKLCAASALGAEIHSDRVPLSPAGRAALDRERSLLETILTGGDDYEALAAVPVDAQASFEAAALAAGVTVTDIGRMVSGEGLAVRAPSGAALRFERDSYGHF